MVWVLLGVSVARMQMKRWFECNLALEGNLNYIRCSRNLKEV